MSNVMQFMSTTGIVILAFVLGVTVGRFGAYAMGMKFGMRYGMEMTMMNLYKIFKKHGIYDKFREIMEKEVSEQCWSNNKQ